nr:MAG TPA: hypothetical protein [Crassvirales sp.]
MILSPSVLLFNSISLLLLDLHVIFHSTVDFR